MIKFFLAVCRIVIQCSVHGNVQQFSNSILNFEENRGQIKYPDDKLVHEVKFMYRSGNLKFFLLNTGMAYQLEKYEKDTNQTVNPSASATASSEGFFIDTAPLRIQTYRMDMYLVGANPNPEIIAEGKSQDYTNYLQSRRPRRSFIF